MPLALVRGEFPNALRIPRFWRIPCGRVAVTWRMRSVSASRCGKLRLGPGKRPKAFWSDGECVWAVGRALGWSFAHASAGLTARA
jgi:hypothetical protein